MAVEYLSDDCKEVIEIDPEGKYIVTFREGVTNAQVRHTQDLLQDFMNDDDALFAVLGPGVMIQRVDDE